MSVKQQIIEWDYNRFVASCKQKFDPTEWETLICCENYIPPLNLVIFEYLQILNDLSRSFCTPRRPLICMSTIYFNHL